MHRRIPSIDETQEYTWSTPYSNQTQTINTRIQCMHIPKIAHVLDCSFSFYYQFMSEYYYYHFVCIIDQSSMKSRKRQFVNARGSFSRSVIGPANSCHSVEESDRKPRTIVIRSPLFSRALERKR